MRKTFKRSLALVLALLMLLTVSPMGFGLENPKTCDHNYNSVPARTATHEADGCIKHYECDKCGSYFIQSATGFTMVTEAEVMTSAHTYTAKPDFSWLPDATNGYKSGATFTCSVCNKEVTIDAVVTSVVTKASTCKEEGVRTYTATVNQGGKTYTDTKTAAIELAEHEFVHHDAMEPNCVTDGNIEYYSCKNCDKVFLEAKADSETTEAKIHEGKLKADDPKLKDRTTHNEAEKTVKYSFDDKGNKIQYDCSKGGKEYKVCTVCEVEYSPTTIAVRNHKDKQYLEVPATCLEPGLEAYTACEYCGSPWVEPKEIEALGHKGKIVDAKDPTCEKPGNVEYWQCERCDAVANNKDMNNPVYDEKDKDGNVTKKAIDKAGFSIPATVHDLVFVSKRVDPDCINEGTAKIVKCTTCNKQFMEYNKGDEIPDAAFANVEGLPTYKDNKTAEHYYKEVATAADAKLPAAGHIWVKDMSEGSVGYVKPTCNKEGSCIATCANCKATKEFKIAKTNHTSAGSKVETLPATCEKNAVDVYICGQCGERFEQEVSNPTADQLAKGHKYSGETKVIEPPTCQKEGLQGRLCLNGCGKAIDTKTLPKIAHDIKAVKEVPATCTQEGIRAHYACVNCGTKYTNAAGTTLASDESLKIAKTDHVDKDKDNICDVCKAVVNGCDHICHKTDVFSKLVWFIARLWYQYLGINQTCKCGLPHYEKAKTPLN